MVAGVLSCREAGEKQQEKMLEKVFEQGNGEKADVDIENQNVTIESESGTVKINASENTWPSDAPSVVPEVQAGNIVGVTRSTMDENKNWNIHFEGLGTGELDKYGAALKSNGFKINSMKMPKGGMVNGEKGNLHVMLTVGGKVSMLVISESKE